MPVIIALFCTFLFGMCFTAMKYNPVYVWFASCLLIPVFVLISEFIIPYQGGGASFWPIALILGGLYGAIAGGFGVLIGLLLKKLIKKNSKDKNSKRNKISDNQSFNTDQRERRPVN